MTLTPITNHYSFNCWIEIILHELYFIILTSNLMIIITVNHSKIF